MPKNFYLTTTLPYVNAEAHLGHALEFVRADVIARYHKHIGDNVFFNTGTDEHGIKIYKKALEKGQDPKEFVDYYAGKFKELLKLLGISEDVNFVRTTDGYHIKAAQEFWKTCDKNGYIYKKAYKVKYCVGCELEKTDSELANGKCPDHPAQELELIDEENYFFKFSAFQEKLLAYYEKTPDFVLPESRQHEIKNFVKSGLQDFSISRIKEKMPWGIEVPGDSNQVMYVWFDALVNYISVIGWPNDLEKFNKWHVDSGGMVQYCGKDNLRQQSAMWQAMLLAAGLPNSRKIVIDGFITGPGGVKMSKSLGNVVSPLELISEYGTDALRYYVLREAHPFEDTSFSREAFKDSYNANLANGLGNLVSRVMKMAETNLEGPVKIGGGKISKEFFDYLEKYDVQKAADVIWSIIAEADKYIQETQPFKLVKTDKEKGQEIIKDLVGRVALIGEMLSLLLPETSKKILELVKTNKAPATPLFLRKD